MADTVPTVKVKPWGENQGDFVEINEEDFDEKIHELCDEDPEPGAMTVAELKAELDAKGIEYPANAKKADLVAALSVAEAGE